jgi:fibronectin-binding autotransporter adhesin
MFPTTRPRARSHLLTLACTPLFALSLPSHSLRADATWIATSSGLWSSAANWSTNPLIPNGQDQNVLFSNATLAASTITLSTPITVGSLTFDPAFAYTLAASAANLTLSTSTGNATITVNHSFANVANTLSTPLLFASPTTITNNDLPSISQNNLTLSGALSGAAPLTLNGPGQVVLSGTNSAYTGAITINNGTLFASSATSLGSSTSAADGTTINANGLLAVNTPAAVANEYLTLNGGTLKSNISSTITLNAPLTLTADSLITASAHNAITLNSLVGSSNLTLSTAAFTLAGKGPTNTFTGNLTLTSAASANLTGSLATAHSITLTPGTSLTLALPVGTDPTLNSVAPNSILATGGEIGVSTDIDFRPALSANSTLSGILFNTNNATLAGANSLDMNTFANPSTLRIGGTGSIAPTMNLRPDLATHTYRFGLSDTTSTLTVNATLTDQDAAPNNLDINGGTTTLTANNTYSGTTTIANGTLLITNPNALGTASGTDADSTIINTNGTLKLAANLTLTNEKITLNPGATLTANNSTATYANPITINGGILGTGTYTGTLTGSGNFSVNGATLSGTGAYTGNLTFTGNSTVTTAAALSSNGQTILNAGTLTFTHPINVPLQITGGTLLLTSNTTLSISPITATGGTLTGADLTATYANPISISGNIGLGTGTFTGPISGLGSLTISGLSILNDANTYTGLTTVVTGANVTVNSTNALGDASNGTTLTGGTLTMAVASAEPFTVSGGTLNINASQSGQFIVNSGTLNVNAPSSNPITANGGIAKLNAVSTSALTLHGGFIGLIANGTYTGPVTMGGGNSFIFGNGNATISQVVNITGQCFIGDGTVTLAGGIAGNGDFYAGMPGGSGTNLIIAGPITITSGSFHASNGFVALNSANIFNVPVVVDGATANFNASNTFTAVTVSSGLANFNTTNQFAQIPVVNGGNAVFAAGQVFSNGIVVDSGTATFNGTNSTNGIWNIVGTVWPAGIAVNANNTVSQLIENGDLTVGSGVTLTSQSSILDLNGGQLTLNGTLAGVTSIVKSSSNNATVLGNFSGSVIVQQGPLTYLASTSNVSFSVASASNASLTLEGPVSSTISLQNASGFNGNGALLLGTNAVLVVPA